MCLKVWLLSLQQVSVVRKNTLAVLICVMNKNMPTVVMDACHHAAKLFTVWGTREVAGRIGWTRCVITPPLPHLAPLSARPPRLHEF